MAHHYAKEHDILKLCDRYEGIKIHYCPDCIKKINDTLFEKLKKVEGFQALKHHCVFRYNTKQHTCKSREFYPIKRENFLLAIADIKASAISRKLNIGFRRGKNRHNSIIWNTYHFWNNKSVDECIGSPPKDTNLIEDIIKYNLKETFENRLEGLKNRSEDAWKCPFTSLFTHSELTEKWFKFLFNNNKYFKVPDTIDGISEAKKINPKMQGNKSRIEPQEGLPVYFIRLKLFANHSLSRIADTQIIQRINEIILLIPNYFPNSQELYTLYDEIIFVIPETKENIKYYIENNLKKIKEFTTNYYFEGNYSKTRLYTKDLLIGYDRLFLDFSDTFYPALKERIEPDFSELGENNIEAYHAKLCELCNMAEATQTFWKFNDKEKKIHECLCDNCFKIRVPQQEINRAIEKGEEAQIPHGIGYKIAKWEYKKSESKVCFIKIDINLNIINHLFKEILLREFPLKIPTDKYNDENIGFSIIYEFLDNYRTFIKTFKDRVNQLEKFNKNYINTETKVSNEFEILENFICLRFDKVSEIDEILNIFINTYTNFFPLFCGLDSSKNPGRFPITISSTISNIKFPFFEAWRYLNYQKQNLLNILVVRNYHLTMDYREYQNLKKLNFSGKRIESFLHKLISIDEKTKSSLLIHTEIFNQKKLQWEIFKGITKNEYDINQLMNFYRLIDKGISDELTF